MPRKEYYWKNPAKHRQSTRRYYWSHREGRIEYATKWYEEVGKARLNMREHTLRNRGITDSMYCTQLAKQGGHCATCSFTPPPDTHLCIDHDHKTGLVRGLLCKHCNSALGHARDSQDVLLKLADYLENPPASA